MILQINDDWRIESIPLNFVIMKAYKTKKGDIKWRESGYFPELAQALRRVVALDLMITDLEGFNALNTNLIRLTACIESVLEKSGIERIATKADDA